MVLEPRPPNEVTSPASTLAFGLFHGYENSQSVTYFTREAELIPAALVTAEEGQA